MDGTEINNSGDPSITIYPPQLNRWNWSAFLWGRHLVHLASVLARLVDLPALYRNRVRDLAGGAGV